MGRGGCFCGRFSPKLGAQRPLRVAALEGVVVLRRCPGSPAPTDPIDQELIEGVEMDFPWHVLIRSACCEPEEAEQRLHRLLSMGCLEGTTGDMRPASKTRLQPVQIPVAGEIGPAPTGKSVMHARTPAPSSEQLLRDLRTLRGGHSMPPVEVTRRPPPGVSVAQSQAPRASSSAPGWSVSAPPAPSFTPSSAPPMRSTGSTPTGYSTPAASMPPGGVGSCDVDSPLELLIVEFSQGLGMQRWTAARLREALEEELAGNFIQAIAIIQLVLARVDDPRIRAARQRLQDKSQRATSGVYRSRALESEKANQHAEAAEHWRKVLEATPTDAEAALHTARNFFEAGDLKQAAHFARRATQLAPNNIKAHKLLLRFFQKTGMDASAQREREILAKLGRG